MRIVNRSASPFGLVRLSTLINCHITSLAALVSELTLQDVLGSQIQRGIIRLEDDPDGFVAPEMKARLDGWVGKIGAIVAEEFELLAASDRVARFKKLLNKPGITNRAVYYQVKALREAVDDGLKSQLIYRYPKAKADVLMSWKHDWEQVRVSFPGTETDIKVGVDLWALGHSTACVFYMMRVLEHGIAALARDVQVLFENQNWYNIINEIEAAIRKEKKSLPKGTSRNQRLQFLSESAKEFIYFKDGWRNYVSHNKCIYDEFQARSVMEHVRQFMTLLGMNLAPLAPEELDSEPVQNSDQPAHHKAPERPQ